jgi:antitoxin component YwqK of YwqJK toxin-antitoxin module
MKSKLQLAFILLFTSSLALCQIDSKEVHYLDTTYVNTQIVSYYVGCSSKISDTIISIKYELRKQANWKVFYDSQFTSLQSEFYTSNDTSYSIQYYRNGQKKEENREIGPVWIYSQSWCENGQIISPASNPQDMSYRTFIGYYCNGNKKWEWSTSQGTFYGVQKQWYENGQIQSECIYTTYEESLPDQEQKPSELISQTYWDEHGNIVPPFDNIPSLINDIGAPIFISSESLADATPYYDIKNQQGYDDQMSLLTELVCKKTKLTKPCNCNVGQVYVSFNVERNGKLTHIRVDKSLEKNVDAAFVKAIKKIRKWHSATVNNEKVKVRVILALKLEDIK